MSAVETKIGAQISATEVAHVPHADIPASTTWDAIKYVYDHFAALVPSVGAAPKDAQYYTLASNATLTAETVIPAYIQTLLDDTTAATARTTLGLGSGDAPTFDGLTLTHATDDVSASITTAAGRFASYNLTSGAGATWTFGTQDDYASNVLVIRRSGVDKMLVGTTAFAPAAAAGMSLGTDSLPFSGLRLDGTLQATLDTAVTHQVTVEGTGVLKVFKNFTGGVDSTGHVANFSAFYDGDLNAVGTQGTTLNVYAGAGYNQTCTGNAHALSTVTEVRNCSNPGGAFMEFAAEFSWLGAQWLDALGGSTPTAYTNGDVAYWGRDYSVTGPHVGQEAYLSSETHYVAKYHATSTIDSTHMGTNGIAICTLPDSGPDFGSRAGQTSYAINDGVVITGYAGAVNSNPTDGNHASATTGFDVAFRAGGANGAGWTHQKTYSKIGIGFQALDYMSYGIDLNRRHPDSTGGAVYVRDGAGGVGIWQVPVNSDAYPFVVGKSYNGNQNIRIDNTNAGASATARIEFNTDAGDGHIQQVSTAAGNSTSFLAPGDLYLIAEGSGKFVQLSTNNTGRVRVTDSATFPVTTDGNALGTTSNMWSDLFLASGSVINWNNGDGTLTHAANVLTWDGVAQVFNEAGADLDFRIEGDTNANLFFVDASNDKIIIG
jgi:hypothetical protein